MANEEVMTWFTTVLRATTALVAIAGLGSAAVAATPAVLQAHYSA